jgi:hypothetical protein
MGVDYKTAGGVRVEDLHFLKRSPVKIIILKVLKDIKRLVFFPFIFFESILERVFDKGEHLFFIAQKVK